jgi:glutamate transport system permease protein
VAANVLIEELGPRGKMRVRIGTAAAAVLAILIAAWVYSELDSSGQLASERWTEMFSWSNFRFLREGMWGTLKAAAVAGALSLLFGFVLALMRLSDTTALRIFTVGWVELFRALPLLLMIFAVFFIDIELSGSGGATLGTFWSVVVALVLYNSAVFSEIFRAGVLSLPSGQTEAAQSVGMTYWQTMFTVVLPQAVRRMIPALVAAMATLTKDVSLGFVIGYAEFVRRGRGLRNFTEATNFQALLLVAVGYFIVVWLIAKGADILEKRQATTGKVRSADDPDDDAARGTAIADQIALSSGAG